MSVYFAGAIEDYFNWECESWIEILADLELDEREQFLPLSAVKSYFTTCDIKQQRNLDKILCEVFAMDFPPMSSDLMLRDHTAIFCILLRIGRGKYIKYFTNFEELSDQCLPFDFAHPPRPFPDIKDDPLFLKEFCDTQRRYCVPMLDSHMLHRHFGNQILLPITFKKRLPTHDFAKSHIIEVYSPYNKIIRESDKIKFPNSNIFVLKSFPSPEGLPSYARNVNAFRNIRGADGIIKFYGSFQHGRESHILLEYADKGTLSEFFRTEAPPTRAAEIVDFWSNLLKLTNGLKAIHSANESHQNVCSESILVLSKGSRSSSSWQFKFSKTGIVQAHESYDSQTDIQKTNIAARTDIWCLGFVFSQAALWVADGYKGILDFRKLLSDGLYLKGDKILNENKRLSEIIIDTHAEIENHLRRSDYITKDILTTMVDEMLWDEGRPNSETLSLRADMIISAARRKIAEISSITNTSRRRSQSRNNRRASSLHPPIPTLSIAQKNDTSSLNLGLPRRAESWRIPVTKNSTPVSTCGSTISGAESDFSLLQTKNVYPDNSTGKTTPDTESHPPVTSWFLDSPITESFAKPLTSAFDKAPQHYFQPSGSKHQSIMGLSLPSTRLPEICQSTKPDQRIEISQSPDTSKSFVVDDESGKNLNFEVRLPGALKTLPSQGYPFEYRLPPPLPRGSISKNIEADDNRSRRTQSEPTSALDNSDDIDSKFCTDDAVNSVSPENDRSYHVWSLFNNSLSSTPLKIFNNSNECSRNESTNSSACNSLTNKSPRPSLGSSLLSKSRRLSSAINSRQNSLLSMPDINFLSNKSTSAPVQTPDQTDGSENNIKVVYLDINTCRYWKNLNKSYRRKSKVSLLPGAYLLQPLHKRDHAFIVDDSVSMAAHWPDVCLTFEGLSYVVKGLSPLGTELFFSTSHDTRRRKSNHELCHVVFEKRLQRVQTNIAKRLNLQLTAYRLKFSNLKKGQKNIRPVSFYILSSGLWAPESEITLKETLEQTATLLNQLSLKDQIFISFIGFEKETPAARTIEALSRQNWGGGLRVQWNWWTGNVWRMLRADLDDIDSQGGSPGKADGTSTDMYMKGSQDYLVDDMASGGLLSRMSGIKEVEGIFELA